MTDLRRPALRARPLPRHPKLGRPSLTTRITRTIVAASHHTLALLGLALVVTLAFFAYRADLRHDIERKALAFLQERQISGAYDATQDDVTAEEDEAQIDALARATATDPKDLSRPQAAVALWLARRYRVAPEPVSRLVQEAWKLGPTMGLDPTLILAVMAVESSFNPFAQSAVGAQGLMQVMTKVHDQKYEAFGGTYAAFDPIANLRVGVQVLKECISRAGGVEEGLRYYVGAANQATDNGYAGKVFAEQAHLRQVAAGKAVAANATASSSSTPTASVKAMPVAAVAAAASSVVEAVADKLALLR